MAVGEQKVKSTTTKKNKIQLKDPKTYWFYLEAEGKHCLRDI